jgi:hypothetical protein
VEDWEELCSALCAHPDGPFECPAQGGSETCVCSIEGKTGSAHLGKRIKGVGESQQLEQGGL